MFLRLYIFLLAGLFLAPAALHAQRYDTVEWPSVSIVLSAGDTIAGPVTFFRNEDVLSLQAADGATTTLTPVLVSGFEVTDKEDNQRRIFKTYLWNRGRDYSDYLTPAFFEQLLLGNYSLLKREALRNDMVRDPFMDPYGVGFYGSGFPRWVTYIQESFYLYTPKGNIIPLRNPKRDLKRIFSAKQKQLKQYVKENKLSYSHRNDLIRIVDYYNSLTDPNYQKPSAGTIGKQ